MIPCLDVDGDRVVKGVRFLNLVDSGDPAELAARYESEGADEIAFLDISATIEGRKTALESIRRVRDAIGIPLLVGGGVRRVEDAARLLEAGADRVAVNSAATREPKLLGELASRFGVQCVVLAIDARRKPRRAGARLAVDVEGPVLGSGRRGGPHGDRPRARRRGRARAPDAARERYSSLRSTETARARATTSSSCAR